jgi:hypothetical protein
VKALPMNPMRPRMVNAIERLFINRLVIRLRTLIIVLDVDVVETSIELLLAADISVY